MHSYLVQNALLFSNASTWAEYLGFLRLDLSGVTQRSDVCLMRVDAADRLTLGTVGLSPLPPLLS